MEIASEKRENTLIGNFQTLFADPGKSIQVANNESNEPITSPAVIHRSIIHFFFCLEGSALFQFGPHYSREIQRQHNYFFYNPEKDLPFNLVIQPGGKLVFLSISLEDLHSLFVHEPIPFLRKENLSKNFYDERAIPGNLLVELNQLFNVTLSETASRLFYQGKVLELLALYFSEKKPDTENCPFLNDEGTVRKIKQAKEHLLKNIQQPPTLRELAKLTGLNSYQLKAGFKEIYGNTVYGYLLDHKLDHARMLLDSQQFQVAEVAYQIGYTNPSHFIAAFKRKFGITPKKYLMSKS